MKFKVGFTGTHGTGKTTAALELTAELKKRNVNVDLIGEAARSCPLPINEATTVQSQMWIFSEMVQKEQESKADVIVCDRTVLDVVAYTERISPKQANIMRKFVEGYINSYDLIFYMEPKIGFLSNDGVRSTDENFQLQIKEFLDDEIRIMNIPVIRTENTKERLDKIMDLIEEENV